MDQPSIANPRRREALAAASWFIGAAALAALLPSCAVLGQVKLAKSAIAYQETAKNGKDCDDCIQFVPGTSAQAPATCKIVEGTVSPHGYCRAFTPKPKG